MNRRTFLGSTFALILGSKGETQTRLPAGATAGQVRSSDGTVIGFTRLGSGPVSSSFTVALRSPLNGCQSLSVLPPATPAT